MKSGHYSAGLEQSVEDEIATYRSRQQELQQIVPATPPPPPASAEEPLSWDASPGYAMPQQPLPPAPQSASRGAVAPPPTSFPSISRGVPAPAPLARAPRGRQRLALMALAVVLVILLVAGAVLSLVATISSRNGNPPGSLESGSSALWLIFGFTAIAAALLAGYFVRRALHTPRVAVAPAAPLSYRKPEDELNALTLQISRLEQLRGWMSHDAEFGRLVDAMIGKQVLAAEERQKQRALVTAIVSSVLSLIAGWLLSAVSVGQFFR